MAIRPDSPTSRAWIDVNLDALVANARDVARAAGVPLLPMVKADGYGLGAVAVARALLGEDPIGFGVATPDEGRELRDAGIEHRILVCTPLLPSWIPAMRAHRLTPTLGDPGALVAWGAQAADQPFHVMIDTGMSRAGFAPDDLPQLELLRRHLVAASGFEGAATHFHSADDDAGSVRRQWDVFAGVLATLPRQPGFVHAANSAAALRGGAVVGDFVRPGIYLYGGEAAGRAPRPVAALRGRVVSIRRIPQAASVSYGADWQAPTPTWLATVALGYADGVPRSAAPRGSIELRGRALPIRGRVTMDMTMVETDGTTDLGEVATAFGGVTSVDAFARAAGTVSYEVLTTLGRRVPRVYSGDTGS